MAKFDGKFLTGVIGPAVYKTYRGIQLVTAKSRLTREGQTEKTRMASSEFGISSNLAATIRKNLKHVITECSDGTMTNRFGKAIQLSLRKALDRQRNLYRFNSRSFENLDGFEFNQNSPVADQFFAEPIQEISENHLIVGLPEMDASRDLKFPSAASSCLVHIAVGMYDLIHGRRLICPIQSIEISANSDHRIIPARIFDFEIEPGCLCVSMFSFQFLRKTFAGEQIINNKTFNPAAIFKAVIADGMADKNRTENWLQMNAIAT